MWRRLWLIWGAGSLAQGENREIEWWAARERQDRVAAVVMLRRIGGTALHQGKPRPRAYLLLGFSSLCSFYNKTAKHFCPQQPFSLSPFHFSFFLLLCCFFGCLCHHIEGVGLLCLALPSLKTIDLYCFIICLVTLYSFSWRHISSWVNVIWKLLFNSRHIYLYAYVLSADMYRQTQVQSGFGLASM